MSAAEIAESHVVLLETLLEEEKLTRARKIARLRAAGIAAPCDHLTTEAMVREAAEQMRITQKALVELHEEREKSANKMVAREVAVKQILALLATEGPLTSPQIAMRLDLGERTARRYLAALKTSGSVSQESRFAPWRISDAIAK